MGIKFQANKSHLLMSALWNLRRLQGHQRWLEKERVLIQITMMMWKIPIPRLEKVTEKLWLGKASYFRLTILYATLTCNEKCALKKLFQINANNFLSWQHILVIFHIDMGIILNKDLTSPSSVTLQNWATGWWTWPSSKLLCCVI